MSKSTNTPERSCDPLTFVARFKALLAAKGMTVLQLHRATGLSRAYLTNLREGRKENPSWETVLKLVDAIGCSADDFR